MKYGNISEIAQYNRENGTNFYTMEQVEKHKKENNPSLLTRLAQTTVHVPVTSGTSTSAATSLRDIPKVESTVGNELGYAAGLLTTPMLLGEIGTYGPLVGSLRLGAGTAGSAAGSYIAGKAGDFADKKLGTNWIGNTGRVLGGFAGFGAGMKSTTPLLQRMAARNISLGIPKETFVNLRKEGLSSEVARALNRGVKNTEIVDSPVTQNILAGKLGWAPGQSRVIGHNSESPISKLESTFPAGDTVERGAPLGHVGGTGTETNLGFIGKRPFHLRSTKPVEMNKPMIQLNESVGSGKNAVRNEILKYADQSGADAINFSNIKDNTLSNQDVYAIFKDVDVKPKLSEFERNGKYTLDELHQMGFKLPRKHLQGEDAVKMFKEYGTQYPETTRLYRITGTSGNFTPSPDGTAEFSGQGFTTDPTKTLGYGSETVKRARIAKVENPIELQVVDIPNSQLNRYKAENILKGRSDVEYEPTEDFLIPLDIPRGRAPITLTGNRLVDSRTSLPQIPTQDTPLMQQLRKYVPEARERYGLVGNTNITDEEIAGSLYKKALELGGDTAAVNEVGEPLVLFRGDTKRYPALKPRMSPEELATKKGTMDNSLGTLFLDYPTHYQGVDRYLGTIRNFNGDGEYLNSGTGSKVIGGSREFDPTSGFPKGTYQLYSGVFGKRQTPISVGKLPGDQMESGVNDLNGFVVKTKSVRDATPEISVLNDDGLAKGAVGSKPHMKTILIEDENGFPLFKHPDGSVTEALAGMDNRPGMAEHYRFVLDDAKSKEQGLLGSRSGAPLRDEHTDYNYYALPNFNIRNAKHLLPYDFRIKPQGGSRLIYRKQGGILKRK